VLNEFALVFEGKDMDYMRGVYNVKLPSESFQSLIIGIQYITSNKVIPRDDVLISEKIVAVCEILPSEVVP
jgi:hypothetical protein